MLLCVPRCPSLPPSRVPGLVAGRRSGLCRACTLRRCAVSPGWARRPAIFSLFFRSFFFPFGLFWIFSLFFFSGFISFLCRQHGWQRAVPAIMMRMRELGPGFTPCKFWDSLKSLAFAIVTTAIAMYGVAGGVCCGWLLPWLLIDPAPYPWVSPLSVCY